jgi:hypothetical protein
VFEGDAVELALGLWAATHGVASLLVVKPYFPWPDLDAFIDRTVCMAGIGLAAAARFDADNEMPLDEVVAALDRLRG